ATGADRAGDHQARQHRWTAQTGNDRQRQSLLRQTTRHRSGPASDRSLPESGVLVLLVRVEDENNKLLAGREGGLLTDKVNMRKPIRQKSDAGDRPRSPL